MAKKQTLAILSDDIVVNKIDVVRNQKVMLDSDSRTLWRGDASFKSINKEEI